jgi:hypothetical protein
VPEIDNKTSVAFMALGQNVGGTREYMPDDSKGACPSRVRIDSRREVTDGIITAGSHLARRQIAASCSQVDRRLSMGRKRKTWKERRAVRNAAK